MPKTSKNAESVADTGSDFPAPQLQQLNVSIDPAIVVALNDYVHKANSVPTREHIRQQKLLVKKSGDLPVSQLRKKLKTVNKPKRFTKKEFIEAAIKDYIKNNPIKGS